jgi:anti-anti-sigma factor
MTESCTLAVHRCDGGYLIGVTGKGTVQESRILRDFVSRVLESGAPVVLDLSHCSYLDSTFLGCIVILDQQAKAAGTDFAVSANSEVQDRLLKPLQLHQLLRFVDSPPAALSDAVELPAENCDEKEFCKHLCDAHLALAKLGGPAADTFRRIADDLARDLQS